VPRRRVKDVSTVTDKKGRIFLEYIKTQNADRVDADGVGKQRNAWEKQEKRVRQYKGRMEAMDPTKLKQGGRDVTH